MEDAAKSLINAAPVYGPIILGLVAAIIVLYRALIAEKDKRLADSQQQTAKMTDAFQESSKVYQMFAEKIETGRKGSR